MTSTLPEGGREVNPADFQVHLDWARQACGGPEEAEELPKTQLPVSFYQSRPSLRRIRQMAHSRRRSADSVLLAVLVRLSAAVPHRVKVRSFAGPTGLNLGGCMVGGSGTGKSQSKAAADHVFRAPSWLADTDGLPLGSGEGIAETYMGLKELEHPEGETDPKTGLSKAGTVRAQVRHNAFFYADEGEILAKLQERAGSTIAEAIRSALSCDPLGQTNADQNRNRRVPGHLHATGLLIGIQPVLASAILSDKVGGTPQRFLWFKTQDVTLPQHVVSEPDALELKILEDGYLDTVANGRNPWGSDDSVPLLVMQIPEEPSLAEMLRHDEKVRTGEGDANELNAHGFVIRMRLSALFALLENRTEITMDDWSLAEQVWAVSCAVRDELVDTARRVEAEAERVRRAREVEIHEAKVKAGNKISDDRDKNTSAVRGCLSRHKGRMRFNELKGKLHSRYRKDLEGTLTRGEAAGFWSVEESDDGTNPWITLIAS
jgi:hypothetical protein